MNMRHLYLPYCLDKQADGRWIVLNRQYNPVGMNTTERADYADPLHTVAIKGMTTAQMQELCAPGSAVTSTRVYLYNDATSPTTSAANWSAYTARLKLLMEMPLDA